MFKTLASILRDNWEWRRQILSMARIDLMKQSRGSALGPVWFFVKPILYIAVFGFALGVGLRAAELETEYPYIIWLAAGLIPWFFMQQMLTGSSNVYRRFLYLVTKIKFPLPVISSFYVLSKLFIQIALVVLGIVIALLCGFRFSIYLIQLPVIILVMYLFWVCFSMFTAPLSAMAKDFHELLKALSTLFFWVSGVLFNLQTLNIPAYETVMLFNPVTFFASAYRAAVCENYWLWERPEFLAAFGLVFLVTLIAALFAQKNIAKDVADAL